MSPLTFALIALIVALVALIVGNGLRKWGLEASRANPYRSAAAMAGERASGIATVVNVVGGICLVVAVWSLL